MATAKMHARALASMTIPENHLGPGILGSAVFSKQGVSARHCINRSITCLPRPWMDDIQLAQRHPQEAVLDEAGQRFYWRAVFRNIAEKFPSRRCTVCLQFRCPISRRTGLQIKTGLVPTANEPKVVSKSAIARNLSSRGRFDGTSLGQFSFLEEWCM